MCTKPAYNIFNWNYVQVQQLNYMNDKVWRKTIESKNF